LLGVLCLRVDIAGKKSRMSDRIDKALEAFGQAILLLLQEKSARLSPRQITQLTINFPDSGGPTYSLVQQVMWAEFAAEFFHPLVLRVPEVEDLGRLLFQEVYHRKLPLSNNKGRIANPTFEQARQFFVPRELLGILVDYLERQGSLTYDSVKLREAYEYYRSAWSLPTTPLVASVPLLNFSTDVEHIPLVDSLVIEPLLGATKTSIWQKSSWESMGFRLTDFVAAQFHITGIYEQARDDRTGINSEIAQIANYVITALRLLHDGNVAGPAGVVFTASSIPKLSLDAHWGDIRVPECEPGIGGSSFMLTSNEVPHFQEIFNEIWQLSKRNGTQTLAVALRRFNLSYARNDYDDVIIDLVIALESSLLGGIEDKQQLRYRFALRGAALLREHNNPLDVYRFLQLLYDVRSAIVHGGMTLTEMANRRNGLLKRQKVTIIDIITRARNITRQVIREYLVQCAPGKALADVNKVLDHIIITSISTDKLVE
jgi:hypothetical protein